MRVLIIVAVVCGLLLVIAGAAGGHASAFGLTASSDALFRIGVQHRVAWDSAMQFGFAHVLAAMLACALPLGGLRLWAGWAFLAGVALFSFALLAKSLAWMAQPDQLAPEPMAVLGMLAPPGGIAFMLGWLLLLTAALRMKPAVA